MAILKFIQAQKFSISGAGASIGDTTILLQSMTDPDGNKLTDLDLGTANFGTLEPGNGSNEEQISFTNIVQNGNGTATLSGVKTVLFKSPYTATSGLAKTHAGASTFILSNDAGFYGAILDYVDNSINHGAVPATNSVNGISHVTGTIADANNPIAVGDTDTRVPTQAENDALAGTGTPSSSNKYVTASSLPVVRTYDTAASPATWTKPTGLAWVEVICIGAGGGGGGGAVGANGVGDGGSGGGGGGFSRASFLAAALGANETITIGAGGTSGAGRASGTGNGSDGGDGANSSFGSWLVATGGKKGLLGKTSNGGSPSGVGTGGKGAIPVATLGTSGGTCGYNSNGGDGGATETYLPTGGGGGGANSSSAGQSTGGAGGAMSIAKVRAGGTGGAGPSGAAGGAGVAPTVGEITCGTGGGGGGGNSSGTAGAGAVGGVAGGGGGGGGGSTGGAGGAGGVGGAGRVFVIEYYS